MNKQQLADINSEIETGLAHLEAARQDNQNHDGLSSRASLRQREQYEARCRLQGQLAFARRALTRAQDALQAVQIEEAQIEARCDLCDQTALGTKKQLYRAGWQLTDYAMFCPRTHNAL